jgi:hypothetical protein
LERRRIFAKSVHGGVVGVRQVCRYRSVRLEQRKLAGSIAQVDGLILALL